MKQSRACIAQKREVNQQTHFKTNKKWYTLFFLLLSKNDCGYSFKRLNDAVVTIIHNLFLQNITILHLNIVILHFKDAVHCIGVLSS